MKINVLIISLSFFLTTAAGSAALAIPEAKARSISDVQTKIQDIVNQIGTLRAQVIENQRTSPSSDIDEPVSISNTTSSEINSSIPADTFTRNLRIGTKGDDVKYLQKFLNTRGSKIANEGPASPGNETDNFGDLTRRALMIWQKEAGIPATGFMGPVTRRTIQKILLQEN